MKRKRDNRHQRVNLRMTEEELYFIERASARKGLSISAFARMAVIELANVVLDNKPPPEGVKNEK